MRSVLVFFLLVGVAAGVYAGPNAAVTVTLDLDGLAVGDNGVVVRSGVGGGDYVDIGVYCHGVTNLAAYEIRLSYDPALVDWNEGFTTANNGREEENILNTMGGSTPVFLKKAEAGVVTLSNVIQDATTQTAPEGDGLMAIVSFTTKAGFSEDQEAEFELVRVELQDTGGATDLVLPANLASVRVNPSDAVESWQWGRIKATF